MQTAAISVDPLPITDFSFNQSNVNTFIFANSSQYSTSYFWNFGDGSTATNVAPTYSYLANGIYNVKLKTANHCGVDSLEQTVNITGITAPLADFGVNSSSICLGDSLIVLDQTQGIGIQAYDWRFGVDAFPAVSNGPGPHLVLFQSPGVKQIILGVANAEGISRDTLYVEVREKANAAFTASWQGGQDWSFAQDASIGNTQYLWDFGDGQQSVQPTPVHTYAQPGSYTVGLITIHLCGRDTAYQTITDASVGLQTGFAEHSIVVAPNPCHEQFTLMIEGPAVGSLELVLWDAKGTSVRRSRLHHQGPQTQQSIETASLAEGLYLLQISSGSKRYLQRLVVY
ncbi:MAG: PKD domain-containing protein [Bacteroidota bacterium]